MTHQLRPIVVFYNHEVFLPSSTKKKRIKDTKVQGKSFSWRILAPALTTLEQIVSSPVLEGESPSSVLSPQRGLEDCFYQEQQSQGLFWESRCGEKPLVWLMSPPQDKRPMFSGPGISSNVVKPEWSPEAPSCSYIVLISGPACSRGGQGPFRLAFDGT